MRELTREQLAQLETPCIVADMAQVRRNIEAMQRAADEQGCALRPHIKTHKLPLIARMQVAAGAMASPALRRRPRPWRRAVWTTYSSPIRDREGRIRCAIALSQAPPADPGGGQHRGALPLDQAAQEAGVVPDAHRDDWRRPYGAPLTARWRWVSHRPDGRAQVEGIYGYKSMVYAGKPTSDRQLAAREEGELLHQAAEALRAAGVPVRSISGGSTPTGPLLAATGQVTEIRPGTYVYKDIMLERSGVARHEELALCYVATVVSCHHEGYAVIDGGSKTFQTDIALHTPPANYDGYAVEGHEHLRLTRLYEEHGIVTALNGRTGLRVGEKLRLYPIHVCTAVNMHNAVYLLEDDGRCGASPYRPGACWCDGRPADPGVIVGRQRQAGLCGRPALPGRADRGHRPHGGRGGRPGSSTPPAAWWRPASSTRTGTATSRR